ncbi:hypothetical protein V491_05686 [Pseudogymnoascus sp. VKM F-3775]|nr:hypothetical protein V491_05686 [Pseudogymnoascus sp. VKM F-3775]
MIPGPIMGSGSEELRGTSVPGSMGISEAEILGVLGAEGLPGITGDYRGLCADTFTNRVNYEQSGSYARR